MDSTQFLIWNINRGMWWKNKREAGYTTNVLDAGKFSKHEAVRICSNANVDNLEELMVSDQMFSTTILQLMEELETRVEHMGEPLKPSCNERYLRDLGRKPGK